MYRRRARGGQSGARASADGARHPARTASGRPFALAARVPARPWIDFKRTQREVGTARRGSSAGLCPIPPSHSNPRLKCRSSKNSRRSARLNGSQRRSVRSNVSQQHFDGRVRVRRRCVSTSASKRPSGRRLGLSCAKAGAVSRTSARARFHSARRVTCSNPFWSISRARRRAAFCFRRPLSLIELRQRARPSPRGCSEFRRGSSKQP